MKNNALEKSLRDWESDPRGRWMQTATGRQFWPQDPRPEDVYIGDIASALSQICRFGGHTSGFYSVAQHSVYVSECCAPEDALAGLLHDAAEAYCGDMIKPLKDSGTILEVEYKKIEKGIENAIFERFGLEPGIPESVKTADMEVLVSEGYHLMNQPVWAVELSEEFEMYPKVIRPWSCGLAYSVFMNKFVRLSGLRGG